MYFIWKEMFVYPFERNTHTPIQSSRKKIFYRFINMQIKNDDKIVILSINLKTRIGRHVICLSIQKIRSNRINHMYFAKLELCIYMDKIFGSTFTFDPLNKRNKPIIASIMNDIVDHFFQVMRQFQTEYVTLK